MPTIEVGDISCCFPQDMIKAMSVLQFILCLRDTLYDKKIFLLKVCPMNL